MDFPELLDVCRHRQRGIKDCLWRKGRRESQRLMNLHLGMRSREEFKSCQRFRTAVGLNLVLGRWRTTGLLLLLAAMRPISRSRSREAALATTALALGSRATRAATTA